MEHILDEVLLDLVGFMGVEPEEILEIGPLLALAGGMAMATGVGMGANKTAGVMGKRAGNRAADTEIQKRMAQAKADRDQKLKELVQRRDKIRRDLDQAKASAQRTTDTVRPGVQQ